MHREELEAVAGRAFHDVGARPALALRVGLVARLQAIGAKPVDVGQGDVPWVVLADPEGNEFCVLAPR